MKSVRGVTLKGATREELLPEFSADFPYIATRAELSGYIEPAVPWHWHRTVELFYMESGELTYLTPREKLTFPAGTGGFVNSGVLHSTEWSPAAPETVQLIHHFDPALLGEQGSRIEQRYIRPLAANPGVGLIALRPEEPGQREIIELILKAFATGEEWGYELSLRAALGEIWLRLEELSRALPADARYGDRSNEQLKRMIAYFYEHMERSISIGELADAAFVSKRSCYRLFQENLRMTPAEYMRSCRLQTACRMLAGGEESVTEIARSCGFGTGSYFGETFRRAKGCTPSQFRSKWQDHDKKQQ